MKRVCGFAVSHIVTHFTPNRTEYRGLSVCLSLCHSSEPCKNGRNDQIATRIPNSGGPNEPRITWGPDANMGRGNFEREKYRDTLRSSVQTRLNQSRCHLGCELARAQVSMCYMGQFWWIGAPIVKYRHFLPWAVEKRLNRSICRLGCGLQWALIE